MTARQNRGFLILILLLTALSAAVTFSNRLWKLDTKPRYGLDIQGGVRVVLRPRIEEYKGGKWTPDKLEAVRKILENRVNSTGVSEPLIITKPDTNQIIIELPGLKDEKKALDQIQATASLQFYIIRQLGNKDGTEPHPWSQTHDPKTGADILIDSTTGQPISEQQLQDAIFSNPPVATGEDLLPNSRAVPQPSSGNPVIEFEFNAKGSRDFEDATRANIGRFLAIFLDKKLITAPSINSVIPGKGIIEGNFTLETAKVLSDQLNAGALPVPLDVLETRKLEATLGREAVQVTTTAGLIGLALVLGFMLFWYRLPGLLADIALVLYTIFSIALFKLWPITLTLPGIAGFILSIGMAVDANILIFERFREELRSGKGLRTAIDAGFKRAFTAILDSNVCTAMTCVILYNFGTGPIRGFALTLGLGVAVSMFTAITVTRTFLFALVNLPFAQNPKVFGITDHDSVRHLHTMSRKGLWLAISGVLIAAGLVFMAPPMNGIKPSIDFKGGTELQIPFETRHTATEIQNALVSVNPRYRDSRVVVSEDSSATVKHLASVTTPRLSDAERLQVIEALTSKVGPLAAGKTDRDIQYANVSGTISKELTRNAFEAVLFSAALIVLYLAVRFSAIGGFLEGLKYGACAVIALLHDVLVVYGSFAILGYFLNWQIDSLFVTAMLTVIGFSVHDTIIVFDRVRENLAHRQKGETFSDVTDKSIDQTFSRSLKTSFTVVLTLAALFFFGSSIIHQFAGALLIGIISGTYSSIFNASVLLVFWKQRDVAAAGGSVAAGGGGATMRTSAAPRPHPNGERPLAAPKPTATEATGARSYGDSAADDETAATDTAPRKTSAPRRQPVRRRRM